MTKENRLSRDRMIRYLLSSVIKPSDGDDDGKRDDRMDLRTARELIGAIAGWAGKGKDEIVQVLCREIGLATAAVLKEPLTQVLENRKLQITLEFVPKNQANPSPAKKKAPSRKPAKAAGKGRPRPPKP